MSGRRSGQDHVDCCVARPIQEGGEVHTGHSSGLKRCAATEASRSGLLAVSFKAFHAYVASLFDD